MTDGVHAHCQPAPARARAFTGGGGQVRRGGDGVRARQGDRLGRAPLPRAAQQAAKGVPARPRVQVVAGEHRAHMHP
eukprot:1908813-Pleurochrysis_carterae.AAC.3